MGAALKCRECRKVATDRLTIARVKPNTLCLKCVEKHQRHQGVPAFIGAFVEWYVSKNGARTSQEAVLREENTKLREMLKSLGHEVE